MIDFANDLAVVIVAKHHQDMEFYASETIHDIKAWFQMVKLDLAEDRTEAVLITYHRKNNKQRVGNHDVVLKLIIRYLGVMVDGKLSFKGHLDYAREKAVKDDA